MTDPPEGSIVHAIRRTRYTSDGGIVRCGLSRYPGPTTKAYPVRIDELGQVLWTTVSTAYWAKATMPWV
jgi:hypothetical protein